MSTPSEPGAPGAESTGPGPVDPGQRPGRVPGRITEPGEAPPWQRGGQARPSAASSRPDAGPAQPSPGAEDRVRRFVTGTAAPDLTATYPVVNAHPAASAAVAAKVPGPAPAAKGVPKGAPPANPDQSERAYASELPDLSDAPPRRTAVRRPQVAQRTRGPLRASMQVRRIDPWSALKVSALLSTALFFAWMIAVAVLYIALGAMGVWSKLNTNVGDLLTNNSAAELVSAGSIFGGAALIGLMNIVVLTAMATLGAVIYNLSTDVVGGVEVTLADRD